MNVDKERLGNRIKKIRVENKISMQKFADMINKHTPSITPGKSNVSRWERGENIPNDLTLKAIADIGNVTVDYLLYGDDLEKITNLAHEIINNNIKNNYDQEYKFFYNPHNFNDLCFDVFTNLSAQNSLKENFNEYNVKDFINRKAKEMLQKKLSCQLLMKTL
ncbi:helix-turn-helix transcriptional regulator [Globicatella sp. PHS-GS-PNBC-21-1553]|uniref:helix-turn-helix domain-containing protein n=1 Tax=Globicatella sp. PHS-GS-PNBC-21-1553 TaxID=2885764 RepID=UPI00298F3299|nr:helix-turn-helix transcriptional regulator [Globicatella sp. PHS-GS-PNBC-21-1553]WPC08810.1 helix-turn-helix domain-containing protein [Globicatella sp. PHS-GS-PNBC-21-1553]